MTNSPCFNQNHSLLVNKLISIIYIIYNNIQMILKLMPLIIFYNKYINIYIFCIIVYTIIYTIIFN
jgi:hypothetical protein